MDQLSADAKAIFRLQLPTDARWASLAAANMEDLLTDHAYCEQKAATACISLIQRFSDKEELVAALAPVVTEEWGHFRMVLAELKKRDFRLGRQRKDAYAQALQNFTQKGGNESGRLLDQLLMMALIEARSCDRFKQLSEALPDPYLKMFYRRFMESEAGHYTIFINLAETYLPKPEVQARWAAWLAHERQVLQILETRADRMH